MANLSKYQKQKVISAKVFFVWEYILLALNVAKFERYR